MFSLFTSIKNMFKYRGKLVPWSDSSLEELTFNISTYAIRSFTSVLSGKMYDGEGRPLIKFRRESRGMNTNGHIQANSTDFDVRINIRDDNFGVIINGQPLGIIQSTGVILNAKRSPIGSAVHPPKFSANIAGVKLRSGDTQFSVNLYNRKIATLRVSPTDSTSANVVINENFPGDRIVKVHETLSEEEHKWLVAFAIIEVVYHGHWIIGR